MFTKPANATTAIRKVTIIDEAPPKVGIKPWCGSFGKAACSAVKGLLESKFVNGAVTIASSLPLLSELTDVERNPLAEEPSGVACSVARAMKNKIACAEDSPNWFKKSNENYLKCYTYKEPIELGFKAYFNGLDHHKDNVCSVEVPFLILKVDDECKNKLETLGVFKDPYQKTNPPLPPSRKMFDWLKIIKQMGCNVLDSNGSEEGFRLGLTVIKC